MRNLPSNRIANRPTIYRVHGNCCMRILFAWPSKNFSKVLAMYAICLQVITTKDSTRDHEFQSPSHTRLFNVKLPHAAAAALRPQLCVYVRPAVTFSFEFQRFAPIQLHAQIEIKMKCMLKYTSCVVFAQLFDYRRARIMLQCMWKNCTGWPAYQPRIE